MDDNFSTLANNIISKAHLFLPVLKTLNTYLNNSPAASDKIIMERIVYIKTLFCTKKLGTVLESQEGINKEQLLLAEKTMEKIKTDCIDTEVNYAMVIKNIHTVSDELHAAVNTLVTKSERDINDISIEFCRHMIPIICSYNSRLK